jgi:uncharacterized protein
MGFMAMLGVSARVGTAAHRDVNAEGTDLPIVTFMTATGGNPTMAVEVADTPSVRGCGLGYRSFLPEDQGMLFVGEVDSQGAFWDGNTFIPLTLAWIAADGTILQLTDMPAIPPARPEQQRNTLYSPAQPYRHVIEANLGWFERHGVTVGDRVDLSAALAIVGTQGERPTLCDIDRRVRSLFGA